MDATQWLAALVAAMDPPLPEAQEARVLGLGRELRLRVSGARLTAETARRCAKALGTGVPDLGAVEAALLAEAPAAGGGRGTGGNPWSPGGHAAGSPERNAELWHGFVARRLGEGADPANLLSLLRRMVPEWHHLRPVMAALFPRELAAHEAELADRARDRARRAATPEPQPVPAPQPAPIPQPIPPQPERGEPNEPLEPTWPVNRSPPPATVAEARRAWEQAGGALRAIEAEIAAIRAAGRDTRTLETLAEARRKRVADALAALHAVEASVAREWAAA